MSLSQKENYLPTLNNMGYVTKILDPYCQEFIQSMASMDGPVADLGVGFGFTTQAILKTGTTVYANDIAQEHLDYLVHQVTVEERDRLFLFSGKLPEAFTFKENFFNGVLASRCFHFLKGEEIEEMVNKIYTSLKKDGMLCIVAETPYLNHLKSFIPIYEERKEHRAMWPGYIENLKQYSQKKNTSEWVNLLDPEILERTLKKIGFTVQKVGFIERPYFPAEVKLSGKESAGIIGIK